MTVFRTRGAPATAGRRGGGRPMPAAWPELQQPGSEPGEPAAAPEASPAVEPPRPLRFDETELARALAAVAAEARGREQAAAADREAARLATALEAIAAGLDHVDAVLALRTRQFREAATTLAALATETAGRGGGRLAGRLAEALVTDCLGRLDPGLPLTVEVAPDLADALAATLRAAPGLAGRPGRIAVEAAASLGPGEARLVWAAGEAAWSSDRLHAEAADLVRRLTRPDQAAPDGRPSPEPSQGAEAR